MSEAPEPHDKFELRQSSIEQKIDNHISESKAHREETQVMIVKLLKSTTDNAEAVGKLAESTAGIVEVYSASQGAIKVGSAVGRFVKWLTGIAIIGVGFKYIWDHLGGPPFTG